jgi:hypothetical protein
VSAQRYITIAKLRPAVFTELADWFRAMVGIPWCAAAYANAPDRAVEREARALVAQLGRAAAQAAHFAERRDVNGEASALLVQLAPMLGALLAVDAMTRGHEWRPLNEGRALATSVAADALEQRLGRALRPSELARLSILRGAWPERISSAFLQRWISRERGAEGWKAVGVTVADVVAEERRVLAKARRVKSRTSSGTGNETTEGLSQETEQRFTLGVEGQK